MTLRSKAELLHVLDQACQKLALLNVTLVNDTATYLGTIEWVEDGTLEKISIELNPAQFKTVSIRDIISFTSDIALACNSGTSFKFTVASLQHQA